MRIVCWFSCGAASAVATKLAIAENAGKLPLIIAYTEVAEEHPDNKRFLKDCEAWFGQEIQILRRKRVNMKLAHCDYIAFLIRENLLALDKRNLIDEVGKVQYDLGWDSEMQSTAKTIDVLDMQGKQYRITIQEL